MANPCDISISSAEAADFTTVGRSSTLVASAVAASLLTFTVGTGVISTAHADDFVADGGGPVSIDHAHASSFAESRRIGGITSIDRAFAKDRIYHVIADRVMDSAQAGSFCVDRVSSRASDHAVASSWVQDHRTTSTMVLSHGQAQSFFPSSYSDSTFDTAAAVSFTVGGARVQIDVMDHAHASSALIGAASSLDVAIDHARAGSFLEGVVHATGVSISSADADDFVEDGRGGAIWTCRTETFGMSRLLGADLRSLAVVHGVLCGAGPGGLYALDADARSPQVVTGLTDFGSEAEKRASYAYFGYSGAPLTIRMGVMTGGEEATYSYAAPARVANSPVPGRVKLGKGARSRYWRFTIQGSTFQLHDVKLIIDETSRNI